jgi:hypothetical protein
MFHILLHTYVAKMLPLNFSLNAIFTSLEILLTGIRCSDLSNLYHGGKLQNLSLCANFFSGPIPNTYGKCHNLVRLTLQNNHFMGNFTGDICNCPALSIINVS